MSNPRITGQITNTNYLSFNGENENLTLIGGNVKLSSKLNISLGIGNDWTHSKGENKNKPAIEAKLKYNIRECLKTQFRFREIGGTEQYRVTFGGNYKFDKHNSVYSDLHVTSKDSGKWKYNTGGWIGYPYSFNNGISVSGEFQQNIPLNKGSQSAEKTLAAFDDSNKMFNVILTLPIK